ncbi:MAG TPA: helix-turn-helix domain-containing protein [Chloroflexota bacterium]|nr:helix-turn-helix domain-containing protein [Chloroflexota bacterium]
MAVGRRGEKTAEEIRSAALELFYKRGFQASTLRGIAAKVGIQVGSLYNHIGSKSDLLFEIMEGSRPRGAVKVERRSLPR